MYSDLGVAANILLLVCLVALGGLFYLALSAREIEAAHGLRSTRRRAVASGLLFATTALLVLWSIYVQWRGPASVQATGGAGAAGSSTAAGSRESTAPARADDAALRKQLADLKRELERIEAQRRRLLEESNQLDARLKGVAATPATGGPAVDEMAPTAAAPTIDLGQAAAILAPTFLVLGAVLLLTLGDPRTILAQFQGRSRQSDLRLSAAAQLDELTAAVDKTDYAAGWRIAGELNPALLDRLDGVDFLFLRSYCGVQLAIADDQKSAVETPPRELLDMAVKDLGVVLDEAPNHGEAAYLRALAYAFQGSYQPAVDGFSDAETMLLGEELPFDHNRSVCWLHLAAEQLGKGDLAAAGRLFDDVARAKVLDEQIPSTWLKVRLQNVRRSVRANNFAKASEELAAVKAIERLNAERQKQIDAICAAFETVIAIRRSDDEDALRQVTAFLDRYLPAELWNVDDEIADEHIEAGIDPKTLVLSGEVFRELLFLQAVIKARILARRRRPATPEAVREISRPLLCAFHFHLRQRDQLAALGGLYYLFMPALRPKALGWLRSAVEMGAPGRAARRILDRDRELELQRRDALEWFCSKSPRFLRDPTLRKQTRQALIEELGRFQEFQPLLLLMESSQGVEPEEPTLKLLRDRARYLNDLAIELALRKSPEQAAKLEAARREYARLVESLDATTAQLAELELQIVTEVGRTVLA